MWADSLREYRYLFFTGKGGVGKTSLACATALHLAAQPGKRVLLVSTDPASNLDEVLEQTLAPEPSPVHEIAGLWAANLDPVAAAQAFREKAVAPYRGLLPEAAIASIEEQFSGACTTEIAAFNEFTRLLGGNDTADFDHVVFDTAPTGHTLRLLSLPAAWSGFIDTSKSGMSCVGPLAQLQDQATLYRAALAALQDAERTALVLVARPDTPSLREAARASTELQQIGIGNQRLIVNGVFTPTDLSDTVAAALARRAQTALAALPPVLAALPTVQVPLLAESVIGKAGIARLLVSGKTDSAEAPGDGETFFLRDRLLEPILEGIAARGHGVVLTMGKGGVGKTTLAATVAMYLAGRGHEVLLTTTDPAAHLVETVAGRAEEFGGRLTLGRIDPTAEVEAYRVEVLGTLGAEMDDDGRALLEEDLRSPCTEEIAVFRAFARAVDAGATAGRFVVLDTAPTGHTILLLDAAEAYHREVSRTQATLPESVRALLPRLRDPDFTHVLVVTLAEPTPVHEAQRLQDDLRRAGIEPYAWVVNQSFAASGTTDPLLLAKARPERRMIDAVARGAARLAVLPWRADPLETTLPTKETKPMNEATTILYVCVHNAGRSQMAEAFTNHLAKERGLPVRGESAGTVAGATLNPVAAEVMAELGIPMDGQHPKQLTQAMADGASRVITMGCGVDAEACPARIHLSEDWGLDDPKGQSIETVRTIRDQVRAKVEALLDELAGAAR